MNPAEDMLRKMVESWKKLGHRQPVDEFILKYGQPFDRVRSLGTCGPAKECYANSARKVIDSNSYTYVEGYGLILEFGFPFLHAWLVDANGWAVETTLQNPGEHAYFGVKFRKRFVLSQMVKYKVWGILGGMPQQAMAIVENPALGVYGLGEEAASQNRK